MIRLSERQRTEIGAHGVREFPLECCGVLLGDIENGVKIVRELRPLANAFQPDEEFEAGVQPENESTEFSLVGQERRYLISPDVMFALMQEERRTKRRILGFYHSHPNHPARPSLVDIRVAQPGWTYVIVSIMDGKPADMTAWLLDPLEETAAEEEIDLSEPF